MTWLEIMRTEAEKRNAHTRKQASALREVNRVREEQERAERQRQEAERQLQAERQAADDALKAAEKQHRELYGYGPGRCFMCGKKLSSSPGHVQRKYCSSRCVAIALSRRIQAKKGKIHSAENWRQGDKRTCRDCGREFVPQYHNQCRCDLCRAFNKDRHGWCRHYKGTRYTNMGVVRLCDLVPCMEVNVSECNPRCGFAEPAEKEGSK